jgi:hypothetical protein
MGGHAGPEAGALRHRHSGVGPVVDVEAPGVVEVVLAARAFDRGLRLPVDVEEVVPLAEPARLGLDDREDGPDVVAPAAHAQDLVGRAVGGRGEGLPVPRVEVGRALGERGELRPVHVVIEVGDTPATLVGDGDPARSPKGHRPVAVARATLRARAHHQRADGPLEAVAHGEEVAEGRVDARHGAAVVVDAQAQETRPAVLARGDGQPDVVDDPGAFEVREHDGLSRDRSLAVVVGARVRVVRRGPASDEILELEEVEGVGKARFLGGRPPRHREHDGDEDRQAHSRHDGTSRSVKAAPSIAGPAPSGRPASPRRAGATASARSSGRRRMA